MSKKLIITESQKNYLTEAPLNEGVNTNGVLNKIYVSYGADKYDAQRFEPVNPHNIWGITINKPVGGVWASPLDKNFGTH